MRTRNEYNEYKMVLKINMTWCNNRKITFFSFKRLLAVKVDGINQAICGRIIFVIKKRCYERGVVI